MKIWLAKLVRLWNIFSYQGLQQDERIGPEEYRIILVNRLAFAGAVISFTYVFYYHSFPSSYLYLIEGVLIFGYLSCIFFNRIRYYRGAKFLIILLPLINVFINASSLGRDGGDHLIFIPIFFAIPLIHGLKNKLDIILSMVITFVAYGLLEYTDYSWFALYGISQEELYWNYRANMGLTFILSLMVNYYYFLVKNKQHQELIDTEKKLLAVFNQAYDAIFLVDRQELKILDCSIKAILIFKVKNKQELLGKPIQSLFKKKLSNQSLSRIRKRLRQGGKWHKELECVTVNQDEFWGNVAVTPIHISNEDLLQVRITDITYKKRIEQQVFKAKEQAVQASKAKSDFLANMSHEIRTPLHAIIGITSLLLKENKSDDQKKHLNILKFSSENLLTLINDILDFSKIEAGKVELEATSFRLKDLIESLQQSFTFQAKEKQIDFIIDYDEDIPPTMIGDPVRLNQILNNLVSNALKFTKEGSVKLNVKLLNETEEQASVSFKIKDTGIGIPKDKISVIFEGFTQASTDTTRKFGGTGLGLAIVKNLLELHHSQLKVKSTPDVGSVFSFSIQFAKSKVNVIRSEIFNLEEGESKDLRGVNILLAEDNEINQLVATKLIQPWNVQLDFAENGQVAVEKAQNKTYDIILMDLQMPVMDGYKATRMIRTLDKYEKKPVIIIALTASAMLETHQKVEEAGFDDYVAKPFRPDELYLKIKSHIKKYENDENPSKEKNDQVAPSPPYIGFDKIHELFGNDIRQIEGFLQKCIEQVSTLKTNYKKYMLNQETAALESIVHKVQSFLTFLEASFLVDEIQKGKELLENGESNDKIIQKTIRAVEKSCDQFIEILENEIENLISDIEKK